MDGRLGSNPIFGELGFAQDMGIIKGGPKGTYYQFGLT